MLEKIRIVLVEPSHPGNVGATARAMKTMGLTQLYLVNPKDFPSDHANARSANAVDILNHAVVTETLEQALADCQFILATSARSRTLPWPGLTPNQAGKRAIQESQQSEVAILFGREKSGLTNEELQQAHYHIHIPTDPDYSSLNLAAAVQVICYEIRQAFFDYPQVVEPPAENYISAEEMAGFIDHLHDTLTELDFFNRSQHKRLMSRMRRLFTRARLEREELNILRGIFTAVNALTARKLKEE